MSVYVDYNQPCLPNKNWKYKSVCRMMADTITELNNFAISIGLQKGWFQNKNTRFPHYDLTPNKRKLAIKYGAIEISPVGLIKYFKGKLL